MLSAIKEANIIAETLQELPSKAATRGEIRAPRANEACRIFKPALLLLVIVETTTLEVLLKVPLPSPVNVNAIIKTIGFENNTNIIIPTTIAEESIKVHFFLPIIYGKKPANSIADKLPHC